MEADADPGTPIPPPATVRVELTAGGRQVVIETQGYLAEVADRAVQLWRVIDDPAVTRGHSVVGFYAGEPFVRLGNEDDHLRDIRRHR